MDEGLLNDLLECSVCLERLDTSSRVLPCQHTFCLKCLKVIVESHKELRCPECRVLVEAKIEELPPNVLLMRILEGMRNSTPRKPGASTQKTLRPGHGHQQQPSHQPAGSDGKQLPPHARALHDYRSKEIGDLSFKKGDTIFLHKRLDPFWYQGECGGRSGLFPITYVQVVVGLPAPAALCKALYDFRMSAPDEEGCLAFDKGAIITVHRRVDENWAEGRVEERVGIFPLAFVDLNPAARHLLNSPTLNRAVPPPPELARAGHSDHRHHGQHAHRVQQMSMSTPLTAPLPSPHPALTQSQPTYTQPIQPIAQPIMGQPIMAVPRNIIDTKHSELIHFTNLHNKSGHQTVGLQSVSRINDNFERLRSSKYDYSTTPKESTYQNVRTHEYYPAPVSLTTQSSDSSSSNTNSGLSTSAAESSSSSEGSPVSSPGGVGAALEGLSLQDSTATNTALNVSLPPSSPVSESPTDANTQQERKSDPVRLDAPSSSKQSTRSGPESLLNFGLGLQAALSPSHGNEAYLAARREKRHSLTTTHMGSQQNSQNRHSAEILSPTVGGAEGGRQSEGGRRRRRSAERPLPAPYVALYAYRPQKPDELELKKGCVYVVTERCRDGWYKGRSERTQRAGVFPGNYVAAAALKLDPEKIPQSSAPPPSKPAPPGGPPPPAAPPALAPPTAPPRAPDQPVSYVWTAGGVQQVPAKPEKAKDKSKQPSALSSGVGLMRRFAAMKRSRSPPAGYSCDNPVFEDTPPPHAHVRSGSCPSQLLGAGAGAGAGGSQRLRHKERPAIPQEHRSAESPWQSQHRKSQSLDASARRDRHAAPPHRERFRCIVPYPPNSEYELELKVDDIVLVHRKRGDGWYKGTLQRTGRTGLFPASFVQSCPE